MAEKALKDAVADTRINDKEAVKVFNSGEASGRQKKRASLLKYCASCKDVDRIVKEISKNVNFVEPARKQGGRVSRTSNFQSFLPIQNYEKMVKIVSTLVEIR